MLTVTTPADTFDLISLAAARAALDTDQSDDAKVQALITRASDVLARNCRRVFALEAVEEQLRLTQCRAELVLARYPIVEITSITENGTALACSDYEIDKASGILTRLHGERACFWNPWKIDIAYRAGYPLPAAAPAALQQAALRLVTAYRLGAKRDPMLRSVHVEDIGTRSYRLDELPPDVLGLVRQFRDTRVR